MVLLEPQFCSKVKWYNIIRLIFVQSNNDIVIFKKKEKNLKNSFVKLCQIPKKLDSQQSDQNVDLMNYSCTNRQ